MCYCHNAIVVWIINDRSGPLETFPLQKYVTGLQLMRFIFCDAKLISSFVISLIVDKAKIIALCFTKQENLITVAMEELEEVIAVITVARTDYTKEMDCIVALMRTIMVTLLEGILTMQRVHLNQIRSFN